MNATEILSPYLISLLVSAGIGFIIGLEREFRLVSQKDHFAGLRTFPLVAILGSMIAFAAHEFESLLAVAATFGFILFMTVTYYVRSQSAHPGITTQVSLIITFVLGMMTAFGREKEALAAAVVTTTILSLKDTFRSFAARITEDEVFAFIKFVILTMLVLPFLPDAAYGPSGLLNPREIGAVVVVVSSMSFVSYILSKIKGPDQGILISSFLGGLFSSTAVTWLFSSRSRSGNAAAPALYAGGIILASSIMFLRVAVLTLIFSRTVFAELVIPCLIMALVGLLVAFILVRKVNRQSDAQEVELGNPLNILNALGFGLLYTTIVVMVFYANEYFGSRGLVLSGFVSGFADVDAISIAMSKLASRTHSSLPVEVIVIAMISNTIVKIGIAALRGSHALRRHVATGLLAVILTGGLYLAFHMAMQR